MQDHHHDLRRPWPRGLRARAAAGLALTLIVAGCGDDDAATGDTAEATGDPATTATTGDAGTASAGTGASTSAGTTSATTTTTDATGTTTSTATTDPTDPTTTTTTTDPTDPTTTTTTGDPGEGLDALVDAALWEQMFPERDALYAHDALIAAAADFPAFAGEGPPELRRRELAAFLANIAHETTGGWPEAPGGPYAWGLYFIQEVGCEMGQCVGYCDPQNVMYPCAPGETYHGRGPMQLSWNYNYGQAGDALGEPLLTDPDLVTSDGAIAFKTALWFWMTPQAPKPSAHDVMTGAWQPGADDLAKGRLPGFGMTVNIINGGLECGQPTPPAVLDRLGFYDRFTTLLATTPGDNLSCEAMQPYF